MQNHKLRQQTKIKLEKKLIPTQVMQKAVHLLSLPATELTSWIENQIELNPLLEFTPTSSEVDSCKDLDVQQSLDFSHPNFSLIDELDPNFQESFMDNTEQWNLPSEGQIITPAADNFSTYISLINQLDELSLSSSDYALAHAILEELDEHGFYPYSIVGKKKALLEKIKDFDPPGIGAKNIHEALILQLERKSKENSLAYTIVTVYYKEMLNNRLDIIAKKLNLEVASIQKEIQSEIAILNLRPIESISHDAVYCSGDVSIYKTETSWLVKVKEPLLPPFRLSEKYKNLSISNNRFIQQNMHEAKWLIKMIDRRKEILNKLAHYLVQYHGHYMNLETDKLNPTSIEHASKELGLSHSTISRAASRKYVECQAGILPISLFFSRSLKGSDPLSSSKKAKNLLLELIDSEDKSSPHSDQFLSDKLESLGIKCARRTIVKYRKELLIQPSSKRRVR